MPLSTYPNAQRGTNGTDKVREENAGVEANANVIEKDGGSEPVVVIAAIVSRP